MHPNDKEWSKQILRRTCNLLIELSKEVGLDSGDVIRMLKHELWEYLIYLAIGDEWIISEEAEVLSWVDDNPMSPTELEQYASKMSMDEFSNKVPTTLEWVAHGMNLSIFSGRKWDPDPADAVILLYDYWSKTLNFVDEENYVSYEAVIRNESYINMMKQYKETNY